MPAKNKNGFKIQQTKYSCDLCGTACTSQRELAHHNQVYKTRHLQMINSKTNDTSLESSDIKAKFRCEVCQKDINNKYNLDQHNKSKSHLKKSEGNESRRRLRRI